MDMLVGGLPTSRRGLPGTAVRPYIDKMRTYKTGRCDVGHPMQLVFENDSNRKA